MPANAPKAAMAPAQRSKGSMMQEKEKTLDVRASNIMAARGVADVVRTSLGPKGMDKMIQSDTGNVMITNDGATILQQMQVKHPAAKMLVDVSKSQDIEAGDGTTSVVVLTGSLLSAASDLLAKGIHPTTVGESFRKACLKSTELIKSIAKPVDLADRESLLKAAVTSLNSKVVSQYSNILAPLAVDAVLRVIDPATATNVDLNNVRVVKKLGGTIDDTEMVDGLVFSQKLSHTAGGPTRVVDAKVALIQFCLSPPKTNVEAGVIVSDYSQMDRILREERKYILNLCKQIKAIGATVVLIQKSILRDATNDMALHFLAKMKILVVKEIERDEIEFISKTLGCRPIASVEQLAANKLGSAALVEEMSASDGKLVKMTGVKNPEATCSILCRGSNSLMIDESERSVHDALCVIRSLVKERFLVAGGGAPETHVSVELARISNELTGMEAHCFRAYADALEVIPFTLAENAGLHPISIVTELRNRHAKGEVGAGINVRKGTVSDMYAENVIQPLLVTTSALKLATETVIMILKIDDIVACR
eukprot:TRINITY_DN244_c0_g1_i1.p1 TRINITY_DN244_c0_g1~~TRINITY_DN244_c0_g1_i1.p1  ORF type:complete len:557 (+),score=182.16 TRINITY_DN244_c0_g1_i1:58-1671(+)